MQEELDEGDNFLLVKIVINEHTVILGSIYGPNITNARFLDRLSSSLANLGNYPVLLGGGGGGGTGKQHFFFLF